MARASPQIVNFNAGELSPHLDGRVDIGKYANGCKRLENFIPMVQGPAKRRAGTRFVAEVKDSAARTWLVRFEFNVEQAYIIEFGHLYIRFYTNHGQVLSAGVPYEVTTIYTSTDLTNADGTFGLQFVESNDVVYIVSANHPPYKLSRVANTNWTFTRLLFTTGPFKKQNTTATTVYSSAATGVVTLTASAAIFSASMVGSIFYLEQKDALSVKQWEAGKSIATGDIRRSNGKNYQAVNTATTGGAAPNHNVGAIYDGDAGVQWTFLDSGFGYVRLDAFLTTTTMTATALTTLPSNAVGSGNPTTRWAEGFFSDKDGQPTSVSFFKERLVFARDNSLCMSVSGDYENFSAKDDGGLVTADMAIKIDLQSDQVNTIQWMADYDSLLVGTAGNEFAVQPITSNQVFGPENVTAPRISSIGSKASAPVRIKDIVQFVQRSGLKLVEILYDFVTLKYQSTNKNVIADHITVSGLNQVVYQQEPYSVIWATRNDGSLLGFTCNKEQDVEGWHRHPIGGVFGDGPAEVESIATIPAPLGDRDEMWMIVKRTVDGATIRYVEWMEYEHSFNDDPEDAFYIDSGLTLNNTKSATLTFAADQARGASVVFTATGQFVIGDIGRYIHYRYSVEQSDATLLYYAAKALITAYSNANTVTAEITAPFPAGLASVGSGDWRMTVTTISGLDHLEGETVQILADGATHPDRTVISGAITLQTPASKIHIGLRCPARLQTMRLNAGSQNGTSQGKTARIETVAIRLIETVGLYFGTSFDAMDELLFRSPSDLMDNPLPLFTGDKVVDFPGDYNNDPWLCFEQRDALPCTIAGIFPQVTTYDR